MTTRARTVLAATSSPPTQSARCLGAHARVLSAAGLSVGLRTAGVTRPDVTEALVAGDTAFPAEPVRGVRLPACFDAFTIASQPRERLFPGAATRAVAVRRAGGQAGRRAGG